ncbi:MAG: tetratricopeptide repeat protein [Pseudomonadota bacterium]
MGFFNELKRRNVFRVAGVYAVVGWLLMQVAAALEDAVNLPAWFDGMVVSLLLICLPLALIFAWAFELTPEGLKRTAQVSPEDSITNQTASKLDFVLIMALLVFAGAMIVPRFLEQPTVVHAQSDAEGGEAEVSSKADASIAVLPFADLSQQQDQEYFADGISEELLNVLAQVAGMKVAGRTSSFAFKGRNEDLREIGRVLGVAHILEGSVRSQGDKVRVTAQLIQVSDGFHLWSGTYDRDLTDIFAVQDDIAEKILVAMKARLTVGEAPTFVAAVRTDISAYNLFLESRDLVFTRVPEKMERAVALLNEAIDIDEGYAPAYALRAKALTLLSDLPGSYGSIPAKDALSRSREDIEKALALDPELADAHAVLGLINADTGRPDFAISSLRRALELNPNSLDARNWLGIALSYNGRLRDVTEQLKKLVEIDPLYRPGVNNTINYCAEIGDLETARRVAERYISSAKDPTDAIRMRVILMTTLGESVSEAIKVQESIPLAELDTAETSSLRFAYLTLGIAEEYRGAAEQRPVFRPWELLNSGDGTQAIELAEAAVQEFPDYFIAHTVYVNILGILGRHEEIAEYFQQEYDGDLERYSTLLRPSMNVDPPPYAPLALAMRETGNEELYKRIMQRWRFTIDMFRAGGSVSPARDLDEVAYYGVLGDADKVMEFLELAASKTAVLSVNDFVGPYLDVVKDDPRFLALRAANLEIVNAERDALGYQPLPESYFDSAASSLTL